MIYIDDRTGRIIVLEDTEDDWEEPVGCVMHPTCRADELAWALNVPGRLLVRRVRYERK